MLRPAASLIAILLLFLTASSWAEEVTENDSFMNMYEHFQLWNDCQPVGLVVGGIGKDESDIGLEEEALTRAVRSRLRSARIYDANASSWLYVRVNIVRAAFNITMNYFKPMTDQASGVTLPATHWNTGGTGTQSRNPGYILSAVSQYMDEFIDDYLRVNSDACE